VANVIAAALFLELWKRYSAEITHRWDLTGFDIQEEHPRPQYLARLAHVKRQEINVVTNIEEPHVPFWRLRVPITIFSFSVVMLLVIFLPPATISDKRALNFDIS
jgi:anoctamin-1